MLSDLLGGTLGAGLGAGAGQQGRGAGVLDLLKPLDYPRQALANLGRGGYRLLSGEGSWDDALGMLPGIVGLGAGALTGGAGALLAGSLAGGVAQGLGNISGHSAFDAPEPSALVEALGGDPEDMLQGLAAGIATDPLTYTGLGAGRRAAQGIERGLPSTAFHSGLPIDPERALGAGMLDRMGRPLQRLPATREVPLASIGPKQEVGPRPVSSLPRDLDRFPVPGEKLSPLQEELGQELSSLRGRVPVSETFPEHLAPSEFEERLGRLYGLARDLEADAQASGSTGSLESMRQRASLWNDILGGEHKFVERSRGHHLSGEDIAALEGAAEAGGLPFNDYIDTLPRSHPGHWLAEVDRSYLPEQVQQIVERHSRAVGERNLLPFLSDKETQDILRAIGGSISSRYEHGQKMGMALSDLENMATKNIPWERRREMADAAYAQLDRPVLYLHQGRGNVAEAEQAMDFLARMGYPIDRDALRAKWLKEATDREVYNVVAARQAGHAVGAQAQAEEHMNALISLVGPEEAERLVQAGQ